MNSSILGYSFIDSEEDKQTVIKEPFNTKHILNKLKHNKNNKQPVKKQPVTAFSEEDEENSNINKTPHPLFEGFTSYDMNEQNNGPHTPPITINNSNETLYDFNKHMPNEQRTQPENDNVQEKINYIIHMLEENRQMRTENITEEMIMYFFLGFFVLYISENFVKMGKYTR
jgi:hypothetical protein